MFSGSFLMLYLNFKLVSDDFLLFSKIFEIFYVFRFFIKLMTKNIIDTPLDNHEHALSGANMHTG